MKILVATTNAGKFGEILEVLESLEAYEFVSLKDVGLTQDCDETGETYEANALLKAHFYAELSGLPTIADDSGLQVDALVGELGVKTRRWGAGPTASDEEWLDYFMNRMEKETDRRAEFLCAAAYVNGAEEKVCIGTTRGVITETVEAPIRGGIPLSSVFKPEGFEQVYSALSVDEKNSISHRGKAFQALRKYLEWKSNPVDHA